MTDTTTRFAGECKCGESVVLRADHDRYRARCICCARLVALEPAPAQR